MGVDPKKINELMGNIPTMMLAIVLEQWLEVVIG
jgi:hypothetical protein